MYKYITVGIIAVLLMIPAIGLIADHFLAGSGMRMAYSHKVAHHKA